MTWELIWPPSSRDKQNQPGQSMAAWQQFWTQLAYKTDLVFTRSCFELSSQQPAASSQQPIESFCSIKVEIVRICVLVEVEVDDPSHYYKSKVFLEPASGALHKRKVQQVPCVQVCKPVHSCLTWSDHLIFHNSTLLTMH